MARLNEVGSPHQPVVVHLIICASSGGDAGRVEGRDTGCVALRPVGRLWALLRHCRLLIPPGLPDPVAESLEQACFIRQGWPHGKGLWSREALRQH